MLCRAFLKERMAYAPLSGSLLRTGVITKYYTYESKNFNVMYRSDDLGQTWDSVKTELKGGKGLVVLSADGKVMLHRPDQSATVYRSDDNGATWTAVETGTQTQYARIVADPVDPKTFYVMGSMGTLYKSSDAAKTFTAQEARLQNEQAGEYYNGAGLIRTVPKKEGHLWVPMDQAQVWQPKGFTEYGLAYTEDGGKSWNRCEGASTAISVGIGKAKEGSDYETIFIWGAAKSGDPIGIYRSTDKCKSFERVNDDAHQYGGPGNGNFVQGDMNNFGVVYMSTVGRGLVVGAPEGTKFVEVITPTDPRISINSVTMNPGKATLTQQNRALQINVPSESKLEIVAMNGKTLLTADVNGNRSISLKKIPNGKYIAKVVDASGKLLLKKAIAIK